MALSTLSETDGFIHGDLTASHLIPRVTNDLYINKICSSSVPILEAGVTTGTRFQPHAGAGIVRWKGLIMSHLYLSRLGKT